MGRQCITLAAIAGLGFLGACATLPDDPEERAEAVAVNDPLEPTNRAIYDFNSALDQSVMEPVAQAYRDHFPDWFRQSLRNFLANIEEPYVAGNDLLQGNPRAAADALGRFMINTTFGMLGTQDVTAESGGPKGHKTDIGTTFGVWGAPEGPYLMLPFFGPSSIRDGTGRVADFWAHPTGALIGAQGLEAFNYAQTGLEVLDTRDTYLDPLKEIRRTSLDEYAAIRSLYRQSRAAAITAGKEGQPKTAASASAASGQPSTPGSEKSPAQSGEGGSQPVKPGAVEFIETKR